MPKKKEGGRTRMSSTFNAGIKQAYEKPYGFISASSMLPGIQSTQATQATCICTSPSQL